VQASAPAGEAAALLHLRESAHHLPGPSSTSSIRWEGACVSGGQPLYPIEIYHDGEGKSYLRNGWPKFIVDYDLKMGWYLIFTRREGSHFFCVRFIDTSNCAHAYSAWP
jgi:hypothetical protein